MEGAPHKSASTQPPRIGSTHRYPSVPAARVQNLNRQVSSRGQEMAPFCITMLLTPDYGERAKGKPEAPKAQTPYYCTGRGRASSSLTAPKGYKIPHLSTRGPGCTQDPGLRSRGYRGARRPTPPKGRGVTRAFGTSPPTVRILKPIRPSKTTYAIDFDFCRCRVSTTSTFDRNLSVD